MSYTNGNGAAYIQQQVIDRKPDIITAALSAGRQRAQQAAQELTRKGAMAASAELCNEAINHLIDLAYQTDDGKALCNVDPTGVFERFPVPWGRSYARWGLRRTEADVLALAMAKLQQHRTDPPLFVYDPVTRRWAVNLDDYPAKAAALAYWTKYQLDAAAYRLLLTAVQNLRSRNA